MQQRLQERVRAARAGDDGFTLIELLIVIVILGVLAGIVVFSVNFITDRGTNTACKTDIRNVQAAVEAYRAADPNKDGKYPASMDALVPDYIRSTPSSTKYTIVYNATTGLVTGNINGNAC